MGPKCIAWKEGSEENQRGEQLGTVDGTSQRENQLKALLSAEAGDATILGSHDRKRRTLARKGQGAAKKKKGLRGGSSPAINSSRPRAGAEGGGPAESFRNV